MNTAQANRATLIPVWAVLLLTVWGAAPAADAAAPRRLLSAGDYAGIQTLTDPQVSPDGQWVAYVVATNDREADEPRSAVWMVSWDGGERVPLTNPAKGIRAPRWSPDGRFLSFISAAAGSGSDQIMLLDRRGGAPRALTGDTAQIGAYAWSPDGRRLAVVMDRGAAGVKAAQGGAAGKPPQPIVIDALHFKQDEDGYLGAGQGRHLYLVDVESQKIEALVSDAGFNEDLPAWCPDGRRIAFVRTRDQGPDADGMEDIDVTEARAGGATLRVVRPYAPNHQRLAWSPDGAMLAYLQGLEPKYNQYIQDRIAVVPAGGGAVRPLADALDRPITSYAFSRDAASMTVTVADDGIVYPARIDLRTGAIKRLAEGPFVVSALSEAAGHAAVLYTDDTAPAEVYALEDGRLRKLTGHNDALLAQLRLGAVEDFRFKSRDGIQIRGLIVKPPAFAPGRKYPAILWIHGGPNGQDAHALDVGADQFKRQLLAADGFVVFGINYRGSSGRGSAFAQAIAADWGHREVEDLLAGVDTLVAAGIADPERLGIGGWSYGGILTDYVIARDRRFKAAVSGAGSANVLAMYGSDEYIIQYNNELGAPWVNTALWIKLSYPFLHADRIHTPTLFMGGDKDFDVPIIGGEQMYQALRTLGVPAQLVVYPGQYHGLSRPSFLEDRARRVSAWFGRYLMPAP